MEPNEMNQQPQSVPPSTTTPEPVKTKGSLGGLIAVLVILVLIVLGALYFWGERVSKEMDNTDTQIENLDTQGDSTEPSDIEADLNAQSPDEFDSDYDAAFTELDAAFDAQSN